MAQKYSDQTNPANPDGVYLREGQGKKLLQTGVLMVLFTKESFVHLASC